MGAETPSPPPGQGASPDSALLADWARDHTPALRAYFRRRVKTAADADDLLQDLFMRLASKGELESIERPEQYLFQAAANVLRDRARRDGVRFSDAHGPLDDEQAGEGFSPERVLLGRDELERLIVALDDLKERTRTVFILYHFEGVSQIEIARDLGVSISTVEKDMARANAHLLDRLGEER